MNNTMNNTMNMNKNKNLYISKNQTNDCITIVNQSGFKIYNINPFKLNFKRELNEKISIIKLFYKTNILVFIKSNDYYKLHIWDDIQLKIVGEIKINNKIINFDINRKVIVICTAEYLYIYNFNGLTFNKKIKTFYNNVSSFSLYNEFIAYPSIELGYINIENYNNNKIIKIKAHLTIIQLITFSNNGKFIATTSEKGTIIRLYYCNNGNLFKEFRRGINYVTINELKFSLDDKYLLINSNKNTIHIFDIENYNYMFSQYSIQKYYYNEITYSIFTNDNKLISIGNNKYYILDLINFKSKIIDIII